MSDVIVVAIDGLDKELIEYFDLNNVKQREFGSIDNNKDVKKRSTSELFTNFITGKTWNEHGITGIGKSTFRNDLPNKIIPDYLQNNIRGFTALTRLLEDIFGFKGKRDLYDMRNLDEKTLFDEINNSKPMFVPGYNPSIFWKAHGTGIELKKYDHEKNRKLEYYWDEFEYRRRKDKLLRPINKWFDFLMFHIHRPDVYQHIYDSPMEDESDKMIIKEIYEETDSLVEEIIDYYSSEYDTIIFMSDHGLPKSGEHNENAFYSCNHELFGDETPHITDFHDKILGLVGHENLNEVRRGNKDE